MADELAARTLAGAEQTTERVRFDLEMLGGAFERRYRRLRPEVEGIPWGSLDTVGLADDIRRDAQARWTLFAFNEYRSSIAMAQVAQAAIAAQAPLDLVAFASTFVTDELVHTELGARMAMELGGAAEILFNPAELFVEVPPNQSPLRTAAALVVRVCAVSEVVSSAIGRALWHATTEPLARAVLGRIMRDEFKHAALGAAFLDWSDDDLNAADRELLSVVAQAAVDLYRSGTGEPSDAELPSHPANALTWFSSNACRSVREAAIRDQVAGPLERRGIFVR